MALQYQINPKENFYFTLKVLFAIIGYGLIFYFINLLMSIEKSELFIPLLFYVFLIVGYLFFRLGILVGYIKGNALKVSKEQFPKLYDVLLTQCNKLELNTVPDMYILQSGGVLNAFATAFMGNNYIVLYSEVAEEMFQDNMDTVEFVVAHELGHIKRKHVLKTVLLFPSFILPFLSLAYSRACEFTCDNIGASLAPNGAKSGLILLASGKNIWRKVNIEKFIEQESTASGFWFWFAEKVSSHPRLTKRLSKLNHLPNKDSIMVKTKLDIMESKQPEATDHSKYFPR